MKQFQKNRVGYNNEVVPGNMSEILDNVKINLAF